MVLYSNNLENKMFSMFLKTRHYNTIRMNFGIFDFYSS